MPRTAVQTPRRVRIRERDSNAQGAQEPGSIPASRLLCQETHLSAPHLLHPQIKGAGLEQSQLMSGTSRVQESPTKTTRCPGLVAGGSESGVLETLPRRPGCEVLGKPLGQRDLRPIPVPSAPLHWNKQAHWVFRRRETGRGRGSQ